MKMTLADKLYYAWQRKDNGMSRKIENFMRIVADNSTDMNYAFTKECDGIDHVEYILNDGTSMVFTNKSRPHSVWVKMASRNYPGNRQLFFEGRDLNLINIPEPA